MKTYLCIAQDGHGNQNSLQLSAETPSKAAKEFMRRSGLRVTTIQTATSMSSMLNQNQVLMEVSLLGGTRESRNWYLVTYTAC